MALNDAEIVQALHIVHKRRPAPCVPLSFASLHYQTSKFLHFDLDYEELLQEPCTDEEKTP